MFDVGVKPNFLVVRLDRSDAGIAAENALVREQQFTVVGGGISGIGDCVGQQQVGFVVILGWVQAQKRVAEHGRRAVEVRGGKHQGHRLGVQCFRPFLEAGTLDFR